MERIVTLLLLSAALAAAKSPGFYGGDEEHYDREGDMNDGRWWCSWRLDWGECMDGTFTCTCPGSQEKNFFKIGCCYKFPECGVICNTHDCSRYYHCDRCRDNVGEHDYQNTCIDCLPGYVIGDGNCQEDLNECEQLNGGCEHTCVNTYGSYYCECDDGYSLNEDKHTCTRLRCPEPEALEHGSLTPTEDLMYSSWVNYACDDRRVLLGAKARRCDAQGESLFWSLEQPSCVDTCVNTPVEQRRQCGSSSTTSEQCLQLGCCWGEMDGAPSCFQRPEPLFIRFAGERPTPNSGNGFAQEEMATYQGCAILCSHGSNTQCASIGFLDTGYDEDHDIDKSTCHLFDRSRESYVSAGEMGSDETFDFYDPLSIEGAIERRHSEGRKQKLYQGCFADGTEPADFGHVVWSREDNSVDKCLKACQQQGYIFSGLTNGVECRCSNNLMRLYDDQPAECPDPCAGDPTDTCGGDGTNDVYVAPRDDRYMGCFVDQDEDRDMTEHLWTADEEFSPSQCIDDCMLADYRYAAVQNGNECWCGNAYGRHGPGNEEDCNVRCLGGYAEQNCGGLHRTAVYITEKALRMGSEMPGDVVVRMYDDSTTLTGIPTSLFSGYPDLNSFISPRLILHASEDIMAPFEDELCHGNCYEACGDIYHPDEAFQNRGSDVILRFFYINLSELSDYVGSAAERVFVHAQTVVIDTDINVQYSLSVRARQIFVDRRTSNYITVSSTSPVFDDDIAIAKNFGPPSDLLWQKQSYMCAKILLAEKEQDDANTAFAIIHDLVTDNTYNSEQDDWIQGVRMVHAEMISIYRIDVHFVPFYTKAFLASVMDIYYDQLSLYKNDYDRIVDSTIEYTQFIDTVSNMLILHTTTNIYEAEKEFQASVDAMERSNATYYRMYDAYNESVVVLEDAAADFQAACEEYKDQAVARATLKFIFGFGRMALGNYSFNAKDIEESMEEIVGHLEFLAETMSNLAMAMEKMDRMMEVGNKILMELEKIGTEFDYIKYMGDVEITAQLQVMIVRWQNLKSNSYIILTHPEIAAIDTSDAYLAAILDTCNWGEALTRSMVEHAENLRECMHQHYLLQSKYEMRDRYQEYLDIARDDISQREWMATMMAHQEYDIRLDLNQLLLTFCQAYYYENLQECGTAYKPSFGGSLTTLLTKLNQARRDGIFDPDIPSTVSRSVIITDTDTDPDCNDAKTCPVNYFRKNRILYYEMPDDKYELDDIDKYRVGEIVFDIEGAKPTTDNNLLKLRIESSGSFSSRHRREWHEFLTRALSLTYEYDLDTNHISIHADVYLPYRNTIQHITPYTTWVIQVYDDRSGDIDLSQVTRIIMRLDGSGIPIFGDGQEQE